MEELDIEGLMDMLSRMKKDGQGSNVTDAERAGVMDTLKPINVMKGKDTYDYDFDVDGKTEGYTFSGDAAPSSEAIQRMRDMQNITADGDLIKNLGIGARGLDTAAEGEFLQNTMATGGPLAGVGDRALGSAAETDFLRNSFASGPELMPGATPTMPDVVPPGFHRMPDGTVMADGSMDYAGTGEVSPNPQTVDRTKFNSQFAELSEEEKARVKQLMSGMNDNEKAIFGAGLTGSPLSGYAVQDENYGSY